MDPTMMDPEVLKALTEQLRVFNARASKTEQRQAAQKGEQELPPGIEKEESACALTTSLPGQKTYGEGAEDPSEGGEVNEATLQELPAPAPLRRPKSESIKTLTTTPRDKPTTMSMASIREALPSTSANPSSELPTTSSTASVLEDQWIEVLENFYARSQEFDEARVRLEEAMDSLDKFRLANGKRGNELAEVVEADFFDHEEGFEAYDQAINRRHRSRKIREEEQKALEEAKQRNEERRQKNLQAAKIEAERRKKEAWAAQQEAEFVRRKAEYWADYARRQARGAEKKARTAEIREERFREFPELFKCFKCGRPGVIHSRECPKCNPPKK